MGNKLNKTYDLVIVGAGAAGLFAAFKLCKQQSLKITIIEMGKDVKNRKCYVSDKLVCAHCKPCNMLAGVGGAGTYSSGQLNLSPQIGGDLANLAGSYDRAVDLINEVDDIFLKNGAPEKVYEPDKEEVRELKLKAGAEGIQFIPIKQRHIGTENAPKVINNIRNYLEKNQVKFKLRTKVRQVMKKSLLLSNDEEITFDFCLLAPGRVGMHWLANEMERLGIKTKYEPVDIGIRVEVPAYIMDPICSIQRDPKFHIYTHKFDGFVRTFCTNHKGFVVQELYEDETVAVNGHSYIEKQSKNTNFALISRVALTKPLEDTTMYGKSIIDAFTVLGGGKPIVQRLGDLKRGRRSNADRMRKNFIQPTLRNATEGDISMVMPYRILTNLLESIEKLNSIIPGLNNDSSLLYAPEIKYSAKRIITNEFLETEIENIFVAGDGAGLTRGIVAAAVSGLVSAQGILQKLENH
ncbi:MAG: NAD(P)-binding protein [Candidatus Lokiarchaeota archaeon]|nr:NAD(P)-binding protein [Candidatus Lokiarchaeota archaeon]